MRGERLEVMGVSPKLSTISKKNNAYERNEER